MEKDKGYNDGLGAHRMGRRKDANCYYLPGLYHITLKVSDEWGPVLGRVVGDPDIEDGLPGAPHTELTGAGQMVEEELTQSIKGHYPMVEVMEYVVMPEHLHVLLMVHSRVESRQGRATHLGHVIGGFKKGCNRRFWEMNGLRGEMEQREQMEQRGGMEQRGKPAAAPQGGGLSPGSALGARQAVSPLGYKVPSRLSSGRTPLFAEGYVDVMPVDARQLQTQIAYIRNNPRSRLLRSRNRAWLAARRGGIDTALSLNALRGYLARECEPWQFTALIWERIEGRLLKQGAMVGCDSYGDRGLLKRRGKPAAAPQGREEEKPAAAPQGREEEKPAAALQGGEEGKTAAAPKGEEEGKTAAAPQGGGMGKTAAAPQGEEEGKTAAALQGGGMGESAAEGRRERESGIGTDTGEERILLPVVCHRRDKGAFGTQKERCLAAARAGAVLVSPRIAKGEQEIIDAAMGEGLPVVIIADNGFGERFHPSTERTELCAAGLLLIVSPWRFVYRRADEGISVTECKTMNCVAQALCRMRDDWWKNERRGVGE